MKRKLTLFKYSSQAAPHITNRKELQRATEKERFLKAEKRQRSHKQEKFQAESPSFRRRQGPIRWVI